MDTLSLNQTNAKIISRQHSNVIELSAKVRFVAVKEHLFSDLQGEAVILSLKNGKYYGLNAVGISIWQALKTSVTRGEIYYSITQEYEVDKQKCVAEIDSFLKHLTEEGLIEMIDETNR